MKRVQDVVAGFVIAACLCSLFQDSLGGRHVVRTDCGGRAGLRDLDARAPLSVRASRHSLTHRKYW